MEAIGVLILIVFLAHIIVTPFLLILGHRRLGRRINDQDARLAEQRNLIERLKRRLEATTSDASPPPPSQERSESATTETSAETTDHDEQVSTERARAKPEEPKPVEPALSSSPAAGRVPRISKAEDARRGVTSAGFEKTLTSSWMIWLGALAVGLSAVFLFSYAIEQGWLGPEARVALGCLLGGSLVAAGEWLHRRSIETHSQILRPDYVPPALTASGVFALYVSCFSAYALYGLFGAIVSFIALAGVSFAGLLLSLRQGAFVAIMALCGGYLVPALIESDTPLAEPVFIYLFVLTAACLALMMYRKWWFLAFTTFAGALGWPLLWLSGPWVLADQGALSVYALGVAALFVAFSVNLPVKTPEAPAFEWLGRVLANTSGLGFALSGVVLIVLSGATDYNAAAFIFLGLFAVVGLVFALRQAAYEGLAVVSIIVLAVSVFLWPQPLEVSAPEELQRLGVASYRTAFGPFIMPPEFLIFARALAVFALGAGLGGVAALRFARTPAVWSAIASAAPIYFFVIAYWRIGALEIDVYWASIALAIAIFNVAAAASSRRMLQGRQSDICVGFFATACTAALALTFTCLLREAWLTVAISVEVLALAWIWSELKVREIRSIMYVAVAVVAIRLILNHNILDYEGGAVWAFSWVIYGYGVPALAFHMATRFLNDPKNDPLAALCEILAIGFVFLMVTLQLRIWTTGSIDSLYYDLFDQSVQTIWWIIAAALLLRQELNERLPLVWYGGIFLLGLAMLQIAFGHALANNPIWTGEPVGAWPLLNLLGLAFLAPALLLWGLGDLGGFMLAIKVRRALRITSSALVFIYLSLEVRRAFQGNDIHMGWGLDDAEIYTYSVIWIVYALVLLFVGIVQKSSFWRYSSLAVLIVTVLKVFLYDMSDLTGLYRVASFLGLGLTLIGIGYLYRRFVFR